ncbi:cystic fibrosis transmembrane conductance regulator [Tasmannia lanceolata]|uniref:cystic fibrosis transmembrane conductance regulator n=1 Tax=Tasmannia lanceolata TaxID=3420 RepID=UPI004064803C
MVGLFSRFSSSRAGHRRSQSVLDGREVLPPNAEVAGSTAAAAAHGIEVAIAFKPVEHPVEPPENDQPVKCPLPEPSILNDGTIWKARLSASVKRKADLPVVKEAQLESSNGNGTKPGVARANRFIIPSSISAPEHDLLTLLEECNAAGN